MSEANAKGKHTHTHTHTHWAQQVRLAAEHTVRAA